MRKILGWAAVALASAATGAGPGGFDAPRAFGARDGVLDVSISPDGQSLAIVEPTEGRGSVVVVAKLDGGGAMKPVLSSSGSPDRLTSCHWASDTRLACGIYLIDQVFNRNIGITRTVAVEADGTGVKDLTARQSGYALAFAADGGGIVDWSGGKDGSVLMTRYHVPEATTGTLTAQTAEGLGVDRVDTRTLARQQVEPPVPGAVGYLSDGRGHVRVMAVEHLNSLDQSTGTIAYRYRRKDSRDWQPLGEVTYTNYRAQGFEPLAVDPDGDVVYGLDRTGGHAGLYKLSLDGALKKELVIDRPDADIDELVRIGRQHRVVGASWITDKRAATFFDPELKRLAASLGKALPATPNISFVDASADEQRLVLFASSDTDPGRFYLFDKATKHLAEIAPARAALQSVKLATVTPIRFPAADGTFIPAYLTLPPGSESAKGLPAIVLPHGGPAARDEWNFDWLPQYFANRGYAVIQPEFRGSTGYGDGFFLDNGIRSWRSSVGDVDDAGRWLVKQGIADPAKLAIVGWSYGGYAALQSQVVDPALFKAVVAIAPVTDWAAMKADRKGGNSRAQIEALFGGAANLDAGSPARHADAFAAPVLMFQGDLDQNVPITQSRLMEARLKGAGKRVERIEYKGLDHQLDDSQVRAEMLGKTDTFLRASLGM